MIEITPTLRIDKSELKFTFVRSAGPGGQNVNKVATAVQLRFAVLSSTLPEEVKARLIHMSRKCVNRDGVLIIEARRFRTQERNKEAAIQRFTELVRKALVRPKQRKKTMPTTSSKHERLRAKKEKGEKKKMRQTTVLSES